MAVDETKLIDVLHIPYNRPIPPIINKPIENIANLFCRNCATQGSR